MDQNSKVSVKLINQNPFCILKPRLEKYLEVGEIKLLYSLDKIEAEFNYNKKEEKIIKQKL